MKKIKYFILTIIFIIFIINIDIVTLSVKDASYIFFNKVFVSIFPFIILSDILYNYNYHIFLKDNIGFIISKLFNINSASGSVFLFSLFSSHPSNAIYIRRLLDNDMISINNATNLLCYTYFPSISFVIGISNIIFNNYKVGLYLYIVCFINNVFIGLYLRNKNDMCDNNDIISNNDSVFNTIYNSIIKGINISFVILGNLIIFSIVINIISKYICINDYLLCILNGILELTSGIIYTGNINSSLYIKFIIIAFILCFSSLSILFQSFTILNGYKINIKKILIIKLIFSIMTTFILYLFHII